MFDDDPSLLHLSAQGEPDVVLKPWTARGLLMNRAARTIASIFAGRRPACESPPMIKRGFSIFSNCQNKTKKQRPSAGKGDQGVMEMVFRENQRRSGGKASFFSTRSSLEATGWDDRVQRCYPL